MRRGTTPTHIFYTNTDITGANNVIITYKQFDKTVIEKTLEDGVDVHESYLVVPIDQEDTLKLAPNACVYIQIRVGFLDGSRLASNIICADVKDILKDGEI